MNNASEVKIQTQKTFPKTKQVGDHTIFSDPVYKVQGVTRDTPVDVLVTAKGELGLNDMIVEHAPTLQVQGRLGNEAIDGTIERDAMVEKSDPKSDFGVCVGDQTHFTSTHHDTDFIISRGYNETTNHIKGMDHGHIIDGSYDISDQGYKLAGQWTSGAADLVTALPQFMTPLKNYARPWNDGNDA